MRLLKSDIEFLAGLASRLDDAIAGEPGALGAIDATIPARLRALMGPPSGKDSRTTPRLIRVRLYQVGASEPAADTDSNLPPDEPGTWQVDGLPAMAQAVAACAVNYHAGQTLSGLDRGELERRIRGLRPTLSRRGGDAVWRVPYTVNDVPWLARVDVLNA